MKRRRFWKFALLLAVPLALFAYTAHYNAWRPRIIAVDSVSLYNVVFAPNGQTLTVTDMTYTRHYLCDVASRRTIQKLSQEKLRSLGHEGKTLIYWRHFWDGNFQNNQALVYKISDKNNPFRVSPKGFSALGALSDSKTLIGTMAGSNEIFAWDYRSELPPQVFLPLSSANFTRRNRNFSLSPDAKTLIVWTYQNSMTELELWDVIKKKRRGKTYVFQPSAFHSITYSVQHLFAFPNLKEVEIWDYRTGKRHAKFTMTLSTNPREDLMVGAEDIQLSPDASMIAGNYPGPRKIVLWDTKTGRIISFFKTNTSVNAFAFSPDGRTLASCGDGSVKLWRIK